MVISVAGLGRINASVDQSTGETQIVMIWYDGWIIIALHILKKIIKNHNDHKDPRPLNFCNGEYLYKQLSLITIPAFPPVPCFCRGNICSFNISSASPQPLATACFVVGF